MPAYRTLSRLTIHSERDERLARKQRDASYYHEHAVALAESGRFAHAKVSWGETPLTTLRSYCVGLNRQNIEFGQLSAGLLKKLAEGGTYIYVGESPVSLPIAIPWARVPEKSKKTVSSGLTVLSKHGLDASSGKAALAQERHGSDVYFVYYLVANGASEGLRGEVPTPVMVHVGAPETLLPIHSERDERLARKQRDASYYHEHAVALAESRGFAHAKVSWGETPLTTLRSYCVGLNRQNIEFGQLSAGLLKKLAEGGTYIYVGESPVSLPIAIPWASVPARSKRMVSSGLTVLSKHGLDASSGTATLAEENKDSDVYFVYYLVSNGATEGLRGEVPAPVMVQLSGNAGDGNGMCDGMFEHDIVKSRIESLVIGMFESRADKMNRLLESGWLTPAMTPAMSQLETSDDTYLGVMGIVSPDKLLFRFGGDSDYVEKTRNGESKILSVLSGGYLRNNTTLFEDPPNIMLSQKVGEVEIAGVYRIRDSMVPLGPDYIHEYAGDNVLWYKRIVSGFAALIDRLSSNDIFIADLGPSSVMVDKSGRGRLLLDKFELLADEVVQSRKRDECDAFIETLEFNDTIKEGLRSRAGQGIARLKNTAGMLKIESVLRTKLIITDAIPYVSL